MRHDTTDLVNSLVHTFNVIRASDKEGRALIARAYREAMQLAAIIQAETGQVRPSIEACLKRFAEYKEAGNIVAAGWMLTALQERVAEQDLNGWEALQAVIDEAVKLLPVPRSNLH